MVKYRLADEQDYEKINAFHNRIYGTNRTMEQFIWEFHDCAHGKSIYVIAEDEDKVIGTNCVIPIDIIDGNKRIIKSGKSEDTLVDPEYRGQKIFYKIYEFLFEKCKEANIDIIWGFTSAIKPFKKLDFEIPFDHQQSLAVKDISKSYKYLITLNSNNNLVDKTKILGLCILSKLKTIGKLKYLESNFRIEKSEKVTTGIDNLIIENLMKHKSLFAINQNKEYQNWRIYTNPNYYKTHTYSAFDSNNKLVASIVINSHKNNVAYICQTIFHNKLDINNKNKILQHITKSIFDDGIILVRNWLFTNNSINIEESLIHSNSGYTNLDRGIGFVWKNLSNIDIDPKDFYLSRMATQGVI